MAGPSPAMTEKTSDCALKLAPTGSSPGMTIGVIASLGGQFRQEGRDLGPLGAFHRLRPPAMLPFGEQ
jgi:hypothetical protein